MATDGRKIIVLLLVLVVAGGCARLATGPTPSPGDPAPSATVETMDGTDVDFPGEYRGRVVILSFFSPG